MAKEKSPKLPCICTYHTGKHWVLDDMEMIDLTRRKNRQGYLCKLCGEKLLTVPFEKEEDNPIPIKKTSKNHLSQTARSPKGPVLQKGNHKSPIRTFLKNHLHGWKISL